MQIELFGCTSAGKSWLAERIVRCSRERGMPAVPSEEFVLTQARLNWIQGVLIRTLLVDLLSFAACLRAWGNKRDFFRFVMRSVSSLPAEVAWPRRFNIARNVFKKTGIREIIRLRGSDRQLIVMDEGTLQTANYLFVQLWADPDPDQIQEFLKLVPLPDVAVYVREDESTLIERTVSRGHKRIPDRSQRLAARFIERALFTFDRIASDACVQQRLLIVDGLAGCVAAAAGPAEEEVASVLEIIRAGMKAGAAWTVE